MTTQLEIDNLADGIVRYLAWQQRGAEDEEKRREERRRKREEKAEADATGS